MMKILKYVQSTFIFETNGKRILVDPGKYNVEKGFDAQAFGRVDGLVITHRHADHFDMDLTKAIVSSQWPEILTNEEIAGILRKHGISARVGSPGDAVEMVGCGLHLTRTDHVVDGELVTNFGFLLSDGHCTAFHTSDTRFIAPSQLECEKVFHPDVLLVPISNRGLVMGFEDALYFANEIEPQCIVPMHYDSPKDAPRVNPEEFKERAAKVSAVLQNLHGCPIRILGHGEEVELVPS